MKKPQPIIILTIIGASLLLTVGLLIWWPGVAQTVPQVRTQFGGYADNHSVNGFGILSQLLRDRGLKVDRTTLLTKQIDKYDVLIWTHQGRNLPQDESLDVLENWMNQGKRVIYISSYYDSSLDYWREAYENTTGPEREVIRRLYRERQVEALMAANRQMDIDDIWSELGFGRTANRWLKLTRERSTTFGHWQPATTDSPWLQVPDAASAQRPAGVLDTWLEPNTDLNSAEVKAYFEGWVTVEGKAQPVKRPIFWVYKKAARRNQREQDLWVISAPLFLNNYGILQPENAQMRDHFLDSFNNDSSVIFLETGPGRVLLSTTPDDRIDRPWRWMTQQPFPLFVLQAVLLAVVYCFAKFPVFGRAKQVEFTPSNDFGQHIKEVGRLLKQSKHVDYARERLSHYFQVVRRGHRHTGNPRDSKSNS